MISTSCIPTHPDDIESLGRGPYDPDPDPAAADAPWFLPPDAEVDFELDATGRGLRGPRPLFDPDLWWQAQDSCSAELAGLAVRFGALDERLRAGPGGARQRLALLEVSDLCWWAGDRIGADRLALWIGLRLAGVQDDPQALERAGWAVRRLTAGPGPNDAGWGVGPGAFLGRSRIDTGAVPDALLDLADIMVSVADLHPVTRAAILFHAWRLLGPEGARDLEAAVMAGRIGAAMGQGGALFLPLALSSADALRGTGSEVAKLASWIQGAERATVAALLHLDRLAFWQQQAGAALADLQGRTPNALADLFADWPMVSAPMAEAQIGASRAAVQRNLDLMTRRGLIREMTGQGRYRIWAVTL